MVEYSIMQNRSEESQGPFLISAARESLHGCANGPDKKGQRQDPTASIAVLHKGVIRGANNLDT